MLKPGKFLHIRLSEIESEGILILLQVCTVVVTHKFRGGVWDFWGGKFPP